MDQTRVHCRRRLSAALAALSLATSTSAFAEATVSYLVIQRLNLAGFAYHAAPQVWESLQQGDVLDLKLEQENLHDPQAIRVEWRGQLLGYLPRSANGAAARALARRIPVQARISRLNEHPNPRRRIALELLLPLN